MTKVFVLDAWAFLAFFQKEEPAASRMRRLLQQGMSEKVRLCLSIVNLGEVYYRVGRVKGRVEADQTLETLSRLSITILSATDEIVLAAAALKMQFPISYADAFAAAEAKQHNAVLVTGDPELFQLQGFVKIEKLKRHQH